MADSDGNPAIWEWHDSAVEEPGSGVRSPIRLASHWLCALNELVIFLNLYFSPVKMGIIHAQLPGGYKDAEK